MNIAENIKKYRKLYKMEQKDLAERLNISNKTVSSWECGRTEPHMGMIEAMCKVFQCSKTDLIDGSDPNELSDSTEFYLIKVFRHLNDDGKELMINHTKFLESQDIYKKKYYKPDVV